MNLSKPLLIGLGALLVGKMLTRGSPTAQPSAPQSQGGGASAASPEGGLVGGLGGLLEKLQSAGHGETVKPGSGPVKTSRSSPGSFALRSGRRLSATLHNRPA